MGNIDLSIVIPSFDEEESLPILVKSIHKNLQNQNIIFEVIIVDDGSADNTWNEIQFLVTPSPVLNVKPQGESYL